MATLALSAAGAAIGGAVLPGISILGSAVSGAAIGQAAGALAGGLIDQALFGASGEPRAVHGPRLNDLSVMTSSEGAPIPRIYGRARLAGEVIWATRLEEEAVQRSTQPSGGSGGGKSGRSSSSSGSTRTEYRYYANFAVALCQGEIARIGRVWADGKELDLSRYIYRVHKGTEDQLADALIVANQGVDNAPAYRGMAYIVFEHLALERFGNRIPQLNFEVFRSVDGFEKQVRSVTIIPGAGEFAYEKASLTRDAGAGLTETENTHTYQGGSDWDVSLDQLESTLPNIGHASLVVSWFGSDLRAGLCTVRPGVDQLVKNTLPYDWQVAGIDRSAAHLVSTFDNRPAFGGTPADASVISAIQDMTARELATTFYPFVLMDIAAGNSLPDPYGASSQPVYPWRGRITIDPAPGLAGSPDKSAAASAQVDAFVGSAQISDFTITGTMISYSGPSEWSYRRMILHYAHLCKAAGGVDAFLIGTELRGLTWVRDGASSYPFVQALIQLAGDVKTILGTETKVSYAADWSEYFGHQPSDGTSDVHFHLDSLWASNDIDAVGIDVYWPLADWRDGDGHIDRIAGAQSTYDLEYLRTNIAGGEGFDWYYADATDRDNQTRTSITDGAGKPWVFRYKDIKSWWSQPHYDRPGGIETSTPTGWVPQSKPIWMTEVGCPAVDKGANQPNVFFDPKSSESVLPHYSRGVRDDLIQRRYLQAVLSYFDPTDEAYETGSNPVSAVYSERMVEPDRISVYTWDARPYPAFPNARDVWSDGDNWFFGHWLTGRLAGGPLAAVVAAIMEDYGFASYTAAGLTGILDGFVLDRPMSARQALQPLSLAFFFDSIESDGLIQFRHRGRSGVAMELAADQLVEAKPGAPLYDIRRAQETELPASAKLRYLDSANDYHSSVVEARRLIGSSQRTASADVPVIMGQAAATSIVESWLQDSWSSREKASFSIPPSRLALEPSDVISLDLDGRKMVFRITAQTTSNATEVETQSIDPVIFEPIVAPERAVLPPPPPVFGLSNAVFLDLPLLTGEEVPHAGYVAAHQAPWPGGVAFFRSAEDDGFILNTIVTQPATIGRTDNDLLSGATSRWDRASRLRVVLDNGALQSVTEIALLAGANLAAVEAANGQWELLQFLNAELVAQNTYELSIFLRGQRGTEHAMAGLLAAGSRFVLINEALVQTEMTADDIRLAFNWRYGPTARDLADATYQQQSLSLNGAGLRPMSPVHMRGHLLGNGRQFSWIRRSRIAADNWETDEVPLGEDAEIYDVEIYDGNDVKRTLTVNGQQAIYSENDQIADWGAPQAAYSVKVYQRGALYGRGVPAKAVI